jgi:hypothetical protein
MKTNRLAILCVAITPALLSSSLFSQIVTTNASDNAGNYARIWGDASNGGSGFQAWNFNFGAGSGGAGRFIGNPANAGITGIPQAETKDSACLLDPPRLSTSTTAHL